jgi:hypothetical protein
MVEGISQEHGDQDTVLGLSFQVLLVLQLFALM